MMSRNQRSSGKNSTKIARILAILTDLKSNKNIFSFQLRLSQMTQKSAKFYDSAKIVYRKSGVLCTLSERTFFQEKSEVLNLGI